MRVSRSSPAGAIYSAALCLIGCQLLPQGLAEEPSRPDMGRLETVVRRLASPEMQGRRDQGARKAAEFLIGEFRRLKLEPLFQERFEQDIPAIGREGIQGTNVGAVLRGSDPALRDQYVIVSAHYDHLGVRGDVVYPGADDNASGVAMMLEVARCLATGPTPPRRSVIFIGFDLEEVGLFGSRYYVAHPAVPLDRVSLFITADMIGRSLGGICERHVFILGTEHAPGLRTWIDEAARDQPVTIGLLGSDLLLLNRSDYGPFRNRRVPYVFFSTGENPLYHSPKDRPETLNYPKLSAITQVIHGLTVTASNAPEVPRWNDTPDHPMEEAVTIRDVVRLFVQNRETLKLGSAQLFLMNRTLGAVEDIIAKGTMSPTDRAGMIQSARLVLMMVQ